jgi:hypothetical protein
MAQVCGKPQLSTLSDVPTVPMTGPGLDPERLALYNQASALARGAGIGWLDAAQICEQAQELSELQANDGTADAPWLDATELTTPPRPWSDEDWQRDRRRAAAAGVGIDRETWQAAAELGHDAVGQLAGDQQAEAISTLKQRNAGALDAARQREDTRRAAAISDELLSRAKARAQAARVA